MNKAILKRMKLRLCIDARMAYSSGIGTCIRNIVPFFKDPPFETTLLVRQKGEEWCKDFPQILFSAPIYSLKEQFLYPLKIPPCELFWSPHYNIPLLPIRAKKRIVTIHDTYHLALGSFLEKSYAKLVMRQALFRSDQTLTVSHFSKSEIQKYVGKKAIEVIPIASTQFKRALNSQLLCKYPLPEKFILFVGNLKPHKNVTGLVHAFAKANLPGWGLVFVGKGAPVPGALCLGTVPEEELPLFYSKAQMLVFPSFYEGFGLPPLEAMRCGCPTIVSQTASLPEVCGEASLYVDPYNIEEIASAIVRLATDESLKKHLIQKGAERVEQFHWERTGQRYRELFQQLL